MKRQYVLKMLPEELSSDRGFIQRLEEEVGMLAALIIQISYVCTTSLLLKGNIF